MNRQTLQTKSMNSFAFEHYLRTGEKLTTAQFIEMYEKKFNPNHDHLGRFTFGSGLNGLGPSSAIRNSNSKPSATSTNESWTDILRSVFEAPAAKPTAPAAPRARIGQSTVAEISEYPQAGKNSWRSSNDKTFIVAAAYYNYKYHLEPGDQGYRTPEFLKAWAMVESGGEDHQEAFQRDPFQVNNPGDYPKKPDYSKWRIAGLFKYQKMTPGTIALAALEWLRFKGQERDSQGRIIKTFSDEEALQNYHGRTDRSPEWGNVMHKVWYAAKVLRLAAQAASSPK